MSSAARAHRRRAERAARSPHRRPEPLPAGDTFGTQIGWCVEEERAATRQHTHDSLIAQMGDRRTGGVVWGEHTGTDAIDIVHAYFDGKTDAGHIEARAEILRLLAEHGGWVVIAMVPGDPA